MPWKHIDVVLYLTAVKLPGTCTRSVLRSFEMATHIMTLPPPKLSTFWTQEEEKRSFWRLYTRILPLHFCSRKRDSSLNQILRQFRNVQPLNLLHQRTLSRLCNGVNTAPKYGLLDLEYLQVKDYFNIYTKKKVKHPHVFFWNDECITRFQRFLQSSRWDIWVLMLHMFSPFYFASFIDRIKIPIHRERVFKEYELIFISL